MAYIVYLDSVALPVTPSRIQMKINNNNKTITLINDSEVNLLKNAGLTDVSFTAMIPHVRLPFAIYPEGFRSASFYLEKFEQLKVDKKPFQLICTRTSPRGDFLFDTNLKVSLEDYRIDEDSANGQVINVTVNLKQYKDYGTKRIKIEERAASVVQTRPVDNAPIVNNYTVKSGDTLWNISKKHLGDGSRYPEIAELNNLKNPNIIYPGLVLRIPS